MNTYTIFYGAPNPMKAIGVNQCRMLAFAHDNRGWHTMRNDKATRRAALALLAKGCIEISGDQFRFMYPFNGG